jgi:hypothetical protein
LAKSDSIWEQIPAAEDYHAARDYLSLLFNEKEVQQLIARLHRVSTIEREAKDILRASKCDLLERTVRMWWRA